MRRRLLVLALCVLGTMFCSVAGATARGQAAAKSSGAVVRPQISDWQYLSADANPPSQAA